MKILGISAGFSDKRPTTGIASLIDQRPTIVFMELGAAAPTGQVIAQRV